MSADQNNRTIGKPHYSRADLDQLSAKSLQDRLELIDNRFARQIASRLFSGLTKFMPKLKREIYTAEQLQLLDMKFEEYIALNLNSPLDSPINARTLVKLLNDMAAFQFGSLISAGPQALREVLPEDNLPGRLLAQYQRTDSAEDVADFLLDHFEYMIYPHSRLSWKSMVLILRSAGFLLSASIFLAMRVASFPEINYLSITLYFAALVMIMLPNAYTTRRMHTRQLALYISFTDEFVDNGEELS